VEPDGGSVGCAGSRERVVYLYSEHYRGQGEPASHAQAIRARGAWIPGVIDPSCLGSSQIDGRTLMELYRELGLNLQPAVNAVEAGITEVFNLLVSGQLKVLVSLTNWFREFRKYHRDDKGSGKIVKARRPPHGRDAIPDRQRPAANEDSARTGFKVEAGTPFRERCLDGLTTNKTLPARAATFWIWHVIRTTGLRW